MHRVRLVDRPIGEALLDQRVIAGVGNIVKSEALWECRIDPFAPVSELDDARLSELADVAGRILREGVDSGGGAAPPRLPPRRPALSALPRPDQERASRASSGAPATGVRCAANEAPAAHAPWWPTAHAE